MHTWSARKLHKAFVSGEVSAVEIVDYFLKRINALDPKIKAYICVLDERAKLAARKLDKKRAKGEPLGKMAGVPVTIKDNMNIAGEITTCSSKFLSNYRAPYDATVCKLLEEADAILVGKTNLDEFAMGSSTENSGFFPSHNPWDLKRTPGGSSGGSAAAVAARLTPFALGSDTGGSIRQPAAFCGVVGFKPTYGRVSRYGLVAFASSLDQIGPMATSSDDIGMIMEVLGQHCPLDSTSLPSAPDSYNLDGGIKGTKVGVPRAFLDRLSGDAKKVFDDNLETLKGLGCEIVDVNLSSIAYSIATYYILATAEASTNLARFDGVRYGQRSEKANTLEEVYDYSKEEGYGPEVKRRILLGTYVLSAGFQDAYYKKAQKVRAVMVNQYAAAFKQVDLVAMPVAPSVAFELGTVRDPLELYLADIYTNSANMAGLPAISVPAGFGAEGMPLGLQLLGPRNADVSVVKAAHAFEQATKHTEQMPDLAKEQI